MWSYILDLPNDIMAEILQYLGPDEIKQYRATSRVARAQSSYWHPRSWTEAITNLDFVVKTCGPLAFRAIFGAESIEMLLAFKKLSHEIIVKHNYFDRRHRVTVNYKDISFVFRRGIWFKEFRNSTLAELHAASLAGFISILFWAAYHGYFGAIRCLMYNVINDKPIWDGSAYDAISCGAIYGNRPDILEWIYSINGLDYRGNWRYLTHAISRRENCCSDILAWWIKKYHHYNIPRIIGHLFRRKRYDIIEIIYIAAGENGAEINRATCDIILNKGNLAELKSWAKICIWPRPSPLMLIKAAAQNRRNMLEYLGQIWNGHSLHDYTRIPQLYFDGVFGRDHQLYRRNGRINKFRKEDQGLDVLDLLYKYFPIKLDDKTFICAIIECRLDVLNWWAKKGIINNREAIYNNLGIRSIRVDPIRTHDRDVKILHWLAERGLQFQFSVNIFISNDNFIEWIEKYSHLIISPEKIRINSRLESD